MKKNFKAVSGIFPMPVLMIATYNEDKTINVMNAAWGMAQSMKHLKLCLSSTHKTVKNLKRTGYCSIALATKDLVKESDYFGIVSANNVKDKFEKSHLHYEKSSNIDAPIVSEYPLTMECKYIKEEDDGILVEVLNILVEDKYLNEDGSIKLEEMGIISYDPFAHGYYVVNEKVGNAFSDGKELIK